MVDMILHKVAEAEANKLFKPPPEARATFRWKDALEAMQSVLGPDSITVPPFPMARWYAAISTAIRENGMDRDFCIKLATRIKEGGIQLPVGLQFALQQHPRIFAGHFDGKSKRTPHSRLPSLPEN